MCYEAGASFSDQMSGSAKNGGEAASKAAKETVKFVSEVIQLPKPCAKAPDPLPEVINSTSLVPPGLTTLPQGQIAYWSAAKCAAHPCQMANGTAVPFDPLSEWSIDGIKKEFGPQGSRRTTHCYDWAWDLYKCGW